MEIKITHDGKGTYTLQADNEIRDNLTLDEVMAVIAEKEAALDGNKDEVL